MQLAYHFADRTPAPAYSVLVSRWIAKLRKVMAEWHAAWNTSGRPTPRLHWAHDGEGAPLVDTRSGTRLEHALPPTGRRVLELLDRPKRLADLATEWDLGGSFDPALEMQPCANAGSCFRRASAT